MITEKQFIEILKKMKEYCKNTLCFECMFRTDDCQVRAIAGALNTMPMNYDIEEIEELINE